MQRGNGYPAVSVRGVGRWDVWDQPATPRHVSLTSQTRSNTHSCSFQQPHQRPPPWARETEKGFAASVTPLPFTLCECCTCAQTPQAGTELAALSRQMGLLEMSALPALCQSPPQCVMSWGHPPGTGCIADLQLLHQQAPHLLAGMGWGSWFSPSCGRARPCQQLVQVERRELCFAPSNEH